MKAIILASGIGKRLQPLTNDIPKSLIKIKEKTLIERQIDSFRKCNIEDIVITTGHCEEKIRSFLQNRYKEINFSFVFNPQYDTTNNIYSLWLTKEHVTDDIILIHGDLVFDEKLLKKVIKEKEKNLALVNKKMQAPKKDFKAVIEDKKIKKIGVNYFQDNAYLSQPLYKFSKNDFLIWLDEIDEEIKKGKLNNYAEDAFNNISDKIILKPLYFDKELCMEIDTKEDLEEAKKKIK